MRYTSVTLQFFLIMARSNFYITAGNLNYTNYDNLADDNYASRCYEVLCVAFGMEICDNGSNRRSWGFKSFLFASNVKNRLES